MYRVSHMVGLVAAVTVGPFGVWAKTPLANSAATTRHHHAVRRATPTVQDRTLANMDLSPRDYVVRPYGPRPMEADDRIPTAVDYHFAQEGLVSFGYHRSNAPPVDPSGVSQAALTPMPASRSGVGALVTYALP